MTRSQLNVVCAQLGQQQARGDNSQNPSSQMATNIRERRPTKAELKDLHFNPITDNVKDFLHDFELQMDAIGYKNPDSYKHALHMCVSIEGRTNNHEGPVNPKA